MNAGLAKYRARMAKWEERRLKMAADREREAKAEATRTKRLAAKEQRLLRSLKPTDLPEPGLPDWHAALAARVESRLVKRDSGCIEWPGAASKEGYGRIAGPGHKLFAPHRVVLEKKIGRLLAKLEMACHHCDNPRCCNAEHLFAGSRADNMRDAYAKGRIPSIVPGISQFQPVDREDEVA